MYNRRYEKVFLMLRQETAGYAMGKRPPWGSCVMELKNGRGRLQIAMQGLKAGNYEVYVMAGEESVLCGEIHPAGKEGRCQMDWDFDPDALGDGKKAEDLHTVIVLADGLNAPLTAYFEEKKDWRTDFKKKYKEQTEIFLQAAETAVVAEKPPTEQVDIMKRKELKPVEKIGKEKAEHEKKNTNAEIAEAQKESYHGSFQGLLAKFRQELEELEGAGILSSSEVGKIRSGGVPVIKKQETEEGGLFAEKRELSPFADEMPWKCITPDEISLLAEIPLHWRQEFFFLLSSRKYHHLILQEKTGGIYLGLPAYYREEDAKEGERFGFREFRSVDGEWGYWICFLERKK